MPGAISAPGVTPLCRLPFALSLVPPAWLFPYLQVRVASLSGMGAVFLQLQMVYLDCLILCQAVLLETLALVL